MIKKERFKKHLPKQITTLLLSLTLMIGTCLLYQSNVQAAANPIKMTRLAGHDRYETATKISQYFGQEGYYVVLVNSNDYPDAVTVAPLAKKFEAPILLVTKDNIPDTIKNELARLRTKKVFIIGGTGVISKNVENQLSTLGISIEERIAGQDRYETATKIAHHLVSSTYNSVYAVENEDWRNALAVAPVASWNQCPIVLVGKNGVSNYIKQNVCNEFHNYFLIGETNNQNFISNSINGLTSNSGMAIKSLGNTKEDTNVEIYNTFKNDLSLEKVFLVNNNDIPDALTLGYLAGSQDSMILFVNQDNLTPTENFLYDKASQIKEVVTVGGEGVMPQKYIDGLYDKMMEYKTRQESIDLANQQSEWNKDNTIIVPADTSQYTPEIQKELKEEEELKQYAIWLDKYGISKDKALQLVQEKTGDKNLEVLEEGFANNLFKLDTGKDISNRRFYVTYYPNKDTTKIHYLVDKEDGAIYKEIEGQKNVYTLLK